MIKEGLFLKKVFNSYVLHRIEKDIITTEGDSEFVIHGIEPFYKLSKDNCDDIFKNSINLDDIDETIKLSREKQDYMFDGKDCDYKFNKEQILEKILQSKHIEVCIKKISGFDDVENPKWFEKPILDNNGCIFLTVKK